MPYTVTNEKSRQDAFYTKIEEIDAFRPGNILATHTDEHPIRTEYKPLKDLLAKFLDQDTSFSILAFENKGTNDINEIRLVELTKNDPVVVIDQSEDGTYRFVVYSNSGGNLQSELHEDHITHVLLLNPDQPQATLAQRTADGSFEEIPVAREVIEKYIPNIFNFREPNEQSRKTIEEFKTLKALAIQAIDAMKELPEYSFLKELDFTEQGVIDTNEKKYNSKDIFSFHFDPTSKQLSIVETDEHGSELCSYNSAGKTIAFYRNYQVANYQILQLAPHNIIELVITFIKDRAREYGLKIDSNVFILRILFQYILREM